MTSANATAKVVTLDNCENEPIHLPSAIQPHGVLFACRADTLTIERASTNVAREFEIESALGTPLVELFDERPPLSCVVSRRHRI